MATASNVTVSKPKVSGAISVAPIGTTLPTDASATLAEAFKSLGYISEDGLTNTNTPESGDIKAWGGDTVLTYLSSKTDTFKFKLIEAMNLDVLKTVYGEDNVDGTLAGGLTIKANSIASDSHAWVIDTLLTGGAIKRIVIPDAKITEIGDMVYKDEEALGYELTITAVPDADGNTHYEYIVKA